MVAWNSQPCFLRRLPAGTCGGAPRFRRAPRLLACLALLLGLTACFPRVLPAQTWEYSPYSIKVWLALDRAAELSAGLAERIKRAVAERAWVVAGATWQVEVLPCPAALAFDVARHPELVTTEAVQALAADVLKQDDKLFLLGVRDEVTGWAISARELDCRTRMWQPVVTRRVMQPSRVADESFAALLDAFVPFGRIESSKGKEAVVRVRAGGLVTGKGSPASLAEGTVLVPVIRRNDRLGEPLANGIQQARWTFLTVTGRKGNQLQCQVASGMTSPLGGRSSARTLRLALLAKPRLGATDLAVVTEGDKPVALGGYEVYSKPPDSEDAELLGVTDWRGRIRIAAKPNPLQILYVRNGGRLLARLPVVAGLEPLLTAQVTDDDPRLLAEAHVKGLQNRVMDLVARRELYTARFRRHLQKKEFDQAKTLLEEFRGLESRSDLTTAIGSGSSADQEPRPPSSSEDRPAVLGYPATAPQIPRPRYLERPGGRTPRPTSQLIVIELQLCLSQRLPSQRELTKKVPAVSIDAAQRCCGGSGA